jgi:hypothetical protein
VHLLLLLLLLVATIVKGGGGGHRGCQASGIVLLFFFFWGGTMISPLRCSSIIYVSPWGGPSITMMTFDVRSDLFLACFVLR